MLDAHAQILSKILFCDGNRGYNFYFKFVIYSRGWKTYIFSCAPVLSTAHKRLHAVMNHLLLRQHKY